MSEDRTKEPIQVIRSAMGVRGIRISAVQRYEGVLSSPTILKFRGGGGVQIPERSIYEHLNGHKFHVD